jgi:hypothetical protein
MRRHIRANEAAINAKFDEDPDSEKAKEARREECQRAKESYNPIYRAGYIGEHPVWHDSHGYVEDAVINHDAIQEILGRAQERGLSVMTEDDKDKLFNAGYIWRPVKRKSLRQTGFMKEVRFYRRNKKKR